MNRKVKMIPCVPKKKKVQRFRRKTFMSRAKVTVEPPESYIAAFIKSSQIGAFEHFNDGVSRSTRGFWFAVIFILLSFATWTVYLLAEIYFRNPTHFTRTQAKFISDIYFPATAICSDEPLLESKIQKFITNSFLPKNRTSDQILKSVKTLFAYFYLRPMNEPRTGDIDILNEYLTLNNLTMNDVVKETSLHCEDIIKKYKFTNNIYDCNRNNCFGWKRILTVYGLCCGFDSIPEKLEDGHTLNQSGKLSGLHILLSVSNEMIGKLILLLTRAGNYISFSTEPYLLETYKENIFQLNVFQFEPALQYESLPLASRRCHLPRDGPTMPGRYSKCTLMCLMKAYHTFCGCHPFTIAALHESASMIRNCTVFDILCVWKHIAFKIPKCNNCIASCNAIRTRVVNTFIDFDPKRQFGINEVYNDTRKFEHPLLVHIFYASQLVNTYQRVPRMNWIDLISNLGGILSLALGISLMNLIEIAYIFGYKFVTFCISKLKQGFK